MRGWNLAGGRGQETAPKARWGAFDSLKPRVHLCSRGWSPPLDPGTHERNTPEQLKDKRGDYIRKTLESTLHSHPAGLDQSIPALLELSLDYTGRRRGWKWGMNWKITFGDQELEEVCGSGKVSGRERGMDYA